MAKNFQTFLFDEIMKYSRTYLENKFAHAVLDNEADYEVRELVDNAICDIDTVIWNYCSKIDNVIEEQNNIHFKDKEYIVRGLVNYE